MTLEELRESVRERADYEDDGGRLGKLELNRYINRCIADLYDLITTHNDARVYVVNAPVLAKVGSTANGAVGTFKLPSDFYKMRAVHYYDGSEYHEYPTIDPSDYPKLAASPLDARCGMFDIRFNSSTGTKLLYTFPDVDECDLSVMYIPNAPKLSEDTDTWDTFSGWEDYVIVKAAIKVLSKDQDDTRHLMAELKSLTEDIRLNAGYLDMGNPGRLRRERGGLREARSMGMWGGRGRWGR